MTNLNLPELPKNFRWKVEVTEKLSGVLCYYIILEKKNWFWWEPQEAGVSNDLTNNSVLAEARKLWNRHQAWVEAKKNEGKYYGNDSD
jgi:hypothetical protein